MITPLVGLAVAGLAIAFAAATGKGSAEVLFSGQDQLGPFIQHSASYTVGALLLLIACKGLAYGISLSSFRGGPTFPALFLGGVGGVALSHLPGLPLVAGVAMGIGAMSVVMLRLPLTSVLLATLLLASDGLAVMPLVIVAVVVAYVLSARLAPAPAKVRRPGSGYARPPAAPTRGPGGPARRPRRSSGGRSPLVLAEPGQLVGDVDAVGLSEIHAEHGADSAGVAGGPVTRPRGQAPAWPGALSPALSSSGCRPRRRTRRPGRRG